MTRWKIARPSLPLCCGVDDDLEVSTIWDAAGSEVFTDGQVAWLNRAAEEWPKLRRALREAIDEIEAGMGCERGATEDEIALLGRLCDALGPAEVRRFRKIWRRKP